MATEKIILRDTKKAEEEFAASEPATTAGNKQGYMVKLTETDELALAASGDIAFPLIDPVKKGEWGTYALAGIAVVIAAEEIKENKLVGVNNKGEAVEVAAGSKRKQLGVSLEKANGAGSRFAVFLTIGSTA